MIWLCSVGCVSYWLIVVAHKVRVAFVGVTSPYLIHTVVQRGVIHPAIKPSHQCASIPLFWHQTEEFGTKSLSNQRLVYLKPSEAVSTLLH